jgi:glyoxylase-like metal-dependent hydrolase (beta-lactamase superfamily II)
MSKPPAPLTPELWVAQSDFFATNSGLFVSQGEAAFIDPAMRPAEIDALAARAVALGAAPRWLVITHSHWDHVLGPERLPGIPVVAHARYAETAARSAAVIAHEVGKWEAEAGLPARRTPFVPPLADVLAMAGHPLAVGGLRLELIPVPGHAADQVAVYEPASGCLWAADILSDVEIPFVSHRLDAYRETLERLAGLDLRVLVPGHGTPTTSPAECTARLAHDRAYLAELHGRVAKVVAGGGGPEAALAACATITFHHPVDNAGPHRLNVESAYLELGGEAAPGRVGWQQFEFVPTSE